MPDGLYEAAFEAMLRGSPDLLLVEPAGRIRDAGSRARAVLALGADLPGVNLFDLLAEPARAELRTLLNSLGDFVEIELRTRSWPQWSNTYPRGLAKPCETVTVKVQRPAQQVRCNRW